MKINIKDIYFQLKLACQKNFLLFGLPTALAEVKRKVITTLFKLISPIFAGERNNRTYNASHDIPSEKSINYGSK